MSANIIRRRKVRKGPAVPAERRGSLHGTLRCRDEGADPTPRRQWAPGRRRLLPKDKHDHQLGLGHLCPYRVLAVTHLLSCFLGKEGDYLPQLALGRSNDFMCVKEPWVGPGTQWALRSPAQGSQSASEEQVT